MIIIELIWKMVTECYEIEINLYSMTDICRVMIWWKNNETKMKFYKMVPWCRTTFWNEAQEKEEVLAVPYLSLLKTTPQSISYTQDLTEPDRTSLLLTIILSKLQLRDYNLPNIIILVCFKFFRRQKSGTRNTKHKDFLAHFSTLCAGFSAELSSAPSPSFLQNNHWLSHAPLR